MAFLPIVRRKVTPVSSAEPKCILLVPRYERSEGDYLERFGAVPECCLDPFFKVPENLKVFRIVPVMSLLTPHVPRQT